MTQRERATADVYDTPGTRTHPATGGDVEVLPAKDLVRWGPVVAGLFAALATLITLSVLGLAIGVSAYDPNDPARSFGIGSGIWGAISALIAFAVGGWLAGNTAVRGGRTNGILNGAMVWFVAIPLLLFMFGSGVTAVARAAGSAASTAAQVAAPIAGEAANDPALQQTAQAGGQDVGQAAQATAQALQAQVTPARVEQVADVAGQAAWSTLLAFGLAAAASIAGGYLGGRTRPERDAVRV